MWQRFHLCLYCAFETGRRRGACRSDHNTTSARPFKFGAAPAAQNNHRSNKSRFSSTFPISGSPQMTRQLASPGKRDQLPDDSSELSLRSEMHSWRKPCRPPRVPPPPSELECRRSARQLVSSLVSRHTLRHFRQRIFHLLHQLQMHPSLWGQTLHSYHQFGKMRLTSLTNASKRKVSACPAAIARHHPNSDAVSCHRSHAVSCLRSSSALDPRRALPADVDLRIARRPGVNFGACAYNAGLSKPAPGPQIQSPACVHAPTPFLLPAA